MPVLESDATITSRPAPWRVVRIVAGTAFAAAALYVTLLNVDRAALWAAFGHASLGWVAAGVGSVLMTLILVTVRWRLLIGSSPDLPGGWRALGTSVVIGQAVNIVFPLRFGEGARVAVTCGELGRPLGTVMVGLAVERAMDVAAFGSTLGLLIAAGWLPQAVSRVWPTALTLAIATIAGVLLVIRFLPLSLRWLRVLVRKRSRLTRWFEAQEASVRSGWAGVIVGRRLTALLILTTLILLSSASTNFLIFRAFELPVPPIAALVLLAVLQVGTAIASVPGNIGVFQYLTVVTLATWHVAPPLALAVAIVLHIVSLGPKVLLGAAAAAGMRLRRGAVPVSEVGRS